MARLLDLGINANDNSKFLITAINCGSVRIVRLLLEKGADPKVRDALHSAAGGERRNSHQGALKMCQLLVQYGADIHARGHNARIPLHWAAEVGRTSTVQWLLDAGADPNALDLDGNTPLELAFSFRHDAVVKLLASVTEHNNIHIAVIAGDLAKVTKLLLGKPELARTKLSTRGDTLLHEAARHGSLRVVEALVAAGSNVNAQSYARPLEEALKHGFHEVADFLRNHGALYLVDGSS